MAQKELAGCAAEIRGLAPLVGRQDQTVTDRMADLQERIGRTQARRAELIRELDGLQSGGVDEDDFRAALAQFGPLWESLNSREQARIIHALVERVAYDGRSNKVIVSFRSAGIREMCRSAEKEDGNEP